MLKWGFGLLFSAVLTLSVSAQDAEVETATISADLENRIYIELDKGLVTIDLKPNLAPAHVERVKALVRQGFYDGLKFHRVVKGFMAQTGDPTGTGMGGSSLPDLPAEFSDGRFVRGTVGMARGQSPNSGNSQFFIIVDEARWLEGEHTIFGRVVEGMELIDGLRSGSKADNGLVKKPDGVVAVRLAADIERRKDRSAKAAIVAEEAARFAELKTQEAAAASNRAEEAQQVAENALTSLMAATDEAANKAQITSDAKAAVTLATDEKEAADADVVSTGTRLTNAEKALVNALASAADLSVSAQLVVQQRDLAIAAAEASEQAVKDAEASLSAAREKLAELEGISETAAATQQDAEVAEAEAKAILATIDVDSGKKIARAALGDLAITVASVKRAQAKVGLEADAAAIAAEILSFSKMSFDDATERVSDAEEGIETNSSALDDAREAATEAEAAKIVAEDDLSSATAARVSAADVLEAQKALELKELEAARAEEEAQHADTVTSEPEAGSEENVASDDSEDIADEISDEPSGVVVALSKQLDAALEAEGAARLELASREVAVEKATEAVKIAGAELDASNRELKLAEQSLVAASDAVTSAQTTSDAAENALANALAKLEEATSLRDAAQAVGDEADAEKAKTDAEFAAASTAVERAVADRETATREANLAGNAVNAAEEQVRRSLEGLNNAIDFAAEQKANAENKSQQAVVAGEVSTVADDDVSNAEQVVADLQTELAEKENIAEAAALNQLEKEVVLEAANADNENAITSLQLAEVAEQGAQTNFKRAQSELEAANDARDKASAAALKRFAEASSAAAASASDVPLFER